MDKRFTVHVTGWNAGPLGDWFYITDNKTQKKLKGSEKEWLEIRAIAASPVRSRTELDYVVEIPDEPNPIPYYVDHYELFLQDLILWKEVKCRAVLTYKGCERKSLENGRRLRYHDTPLGPKYY